MTTAAQPANTALQKLTPQFFEEIRDKWLEQSNKAEFAKEVSFALQLINKAPMLKKCKGESVLESVLNITQIGLTLNPALKLAYLVPRYDKKQNGYICQLEASYQGMVKLITDTGSARKIYSHEVYKGDEFSVSLGTNVQVNHQPQFKTKDIEKVYAIAVLADGSHQVEVMTIEDIHKIRDSSESYKAFKNGKIRTCIWVDHESEMSRKTVIRRLCKYLPKTDQWKHLAKAIELDETDYQASLGQISYLESLIGNSVIPEERKEALYQELNTISASRAGELITELIEKQVPGSEMPNPGPDDATQSAQAAASRDRDE